MPLHYFADTQQSQTIYRCLHCQYDTFVESNAKAHCRNHLDQPLPYEELPLNDWLKLVESELSTGPDMYKNARVGTSLLTWNTANASWSAAGAIVAEQIRCKALGYIRPQVIWFDNGSTDETCSLVTGRFGDSKPSVFRSLSNIGQCRSRNKIIDRALELKLDYLVMIDGDIEMVPFSTQAMLRYMIDNRSSRIGCLGMYSINCTDNDNDPDIAQTCRFIDPDMVDQTPWIAWTNYGIFDMQLFRDGIRFEESGPFAGPGWGLDDDDLYMQMLDHGWQSVNTKFYRHLHRKRHSSIRLLDPSLAAKVFDERKSFLINKWTGNPRVEEHLHRIRHMYLPVV